MEETQGRIAAPWTMRPAAAMAAIAVALPIVVAVDYTLGEVLSMRLAYFLLAGFAAWMLGRSGGIAVAIVAAGFDAFLGESRRHGLTALEFSWDAVANLALMLVFAFVVARHRRSVDGVVAQSRIDPETGLLSRREFDRQVEAEARRAERYRRPLALVLVECSGLKGGAGAPVLAAIGRAAQAQVRDGDCVGRVGDQRVGLILLECSGEMAQNVVKRIRERLEEAMRQKLRTGSLSLGIVAYGGQSKASPGELLQLAEAQLRFARAERGIQAADTAVI